MAPEDPADEEAAVLPRVAAALAAAGLLLAVLSACDVGTPDPAPDAEQPASPEAVVDGRVLAVRSTPVAGALVTLRADPAPGCGRCGRLLADRTDAEGRFRLRVPVGTYVLACTVGPRRSCGLDAGARLVVRAPVTLRLLVHP